MAHVSEVPVRDTRLCRTCGGAGGFGRRDTRGGFTGGSTAGPGGEYVGGNRQELDDTVPF